MTLIERDPFTRSELHRTKLARGTDGNYPVCLECERPGKFSYHVQTDGGRRIDDHTPFSGIRKSGPFCSVVCFRSFNL
jgi:hypothetical protein